MNKWSLSQRHTAIAQKHSAHQPASPESLPFSKVASDKSQDSSILSKYVYVCTFDKPLILVTANPLCMLQPSC